jgi:photosystem II stability/assembly factor-like uncharacterized protein
MEMCKIFKTTNSGVNWDIVYMMQNYWLQGLSFPSQNTGYAAGADEYYYNPLIIKTTNAGLNWTTLNLGYNWYGFIEAIYFTSQDIGWVTNGSFIYKTTNGGVDWEEQYTGYYSYINSIFFINSLTGWAACYDGTILKTINGGNFWEQIYNGNYNDYIKSIFFVNPNTGWVSGNSGRIFKTYNGGYNWYRQQSHSGGYLNSIYFVSPSTGWVVGENGIILKTTDGGGPPIVVKPVSQEVPKDFSLSQNYPNPFNPLTKIKFKIPKQSNTKLIVFDILGREVATLVNEHLDPGTYEIEWDASNYSSGVYFYKLSAGNYTETKRMILVK